MRVSRRNGLNGGQPPSPSSDPHLEHPDLSPCSAPPFPVKYNAIAGFQSPWVVRPRQQQQQQQRLGRRPHSAVTRTVTSYSTQTVLATPAALPTLQSEPFSFVASPRRHSTSDDVGGARAEARVGSRDRVGASAFLATGSGPVAYSPPTPPPLPVAILPGTSTCVFGCCTCTEFEVLWLLVGVDRGACSHVGTGAHGAWFCERDNTAVRGGPHRPSRPSTAGVRHTNNNQSNGDGVAMDGSPRPHQPPEPRFDRLVNHVFPPVAVFPDRHAVP